MSRTKEIGEALRTETGRRNSFCLWIRSTAAEALVAKEGRLQFSPVKKMRGEQDHATQLGFHGSYVEIRNKTWISKYPLSEILVMSMLQERGVKATFLSMLEWAPVKTLLTSRRMVHLLQWVNHVRSYLHVSLKASCVSPTRSQSAAQIKNISI